MKKTEIGNRLYQSNPELSTARRVPRKMLTLTSPKRKNWAPVEPWQIQQLQRLAKHDPERLELIMNTLWNQFPGLLGEFAVAAVDSESMSVDECSRFLDISPAEVEERLRGHRKCELRTENAVVHDHNKQVARLAMGNVAVWEVVREYRKLGSVERLREAFPALTEGELAAAMKYAEAHPAEIEALISDYERVLARRREEFPFAGKG